MNSQNIYDKITNLIIELLEEHKASNYSQPWFSASGDLFAKNIVTNHVYSGINQLMLNYIKRKYNYSFNRWLTFKQLSSYNAKIKKGSKAASVVYKSAIYLDAETEKNITKQVEYLQNNNQSIEHLNIKKIGYLKQYLVFNVNCVEGLPEEFYKNEKLDNLTEFERDEHFEFLIENTQAIINHSSENDAFYKPDEDVIYMPLKKQFKSKDDYYNVLMHEIGHWTGHSSRLNRPIINKFGSKEYGFEELIAEINAAFILAYMGYESTITNNVSYIDSWLSVMKNDKQFIIQAASQAQLASDFILEFDKVEALEDLPF